MTKPASWCMYIDGAARNNPGPAGAGIYILKDGQTVAREYFYLGSKTNNQAEYLALLLGLYILQSYVHPEDTVRIISDSLLLVRQINGQYRVRHPNIQPLYRLACVLLAPLQADILHVLRTDNVEADALANKGVDAQKRVPESFRTLLNVHKITDLYL